MQLNNILSLINRIHQKLILTKQNQLFSKELNNSFVLFIQSILTSTSTPELESEFQFIRKPLLNLICLLDQRKLHFPIQLSILIIEKYAQNNRSIIQDIIQHNLDLDPQFIRSFKLNIYQRVQELGNQPEQPQLAHSLSLITQSHPQLLELFYQSPSKPHDTSPFVSIVKIIENNQELLSRYTRTQLIFLIIKILKDGIISKLEQATAAFDSTILTDQLSVILSSESECFLTDLHLNYPSLIDQLKQHPSHTGIGPQNLSNQSKKQLNSFFTNSQKYLIFKIFNQSNSNPIPPNQSHTFSTQDEISSVIKNRKNLFDNHHMDVSLLRKGKTKLDEKAILNDKSHITDSLKMKIKARLEAIELNPDEEDSEIPTIYDHNDDESDELDADDDVARLRQLKKSIQVDIFSDDDHLFFPNKNKQKENSDDEDLERSNSEEEEEEQSKVGQRSQKMATRQPNKSSAKNQNQKHNNQLLEKRSNDDHDRQKKARDMRNEEENRPRNEGDARSGKFRGESRGGGFVRGRGVGDIRGKGGVARGRGASQANKKTIENPYHRKMESPSTQFDKIPPQGTNDSITNAKADDETVETSSSHLKPPGHRGRGAHSNRGGRGSGTRGSTADHQKKIHDRRVRGRDRKLAQVSGGI